MMRLWVTALSALLLLGAGPARAAGFDAIVIDDNLNGAKGDGSYAVGQGPTEREARRVAMSNCTLGGNVACTVKLTYRQCGAYAASSTRSGSGTAATQAAATAAALASCGASSCKLVVADCVEAPLRPPSR